MPPTNLLILCGLIFVAATLYSSVGHAGASGYLAAMALMAVSPAVMKPTALVLNILVASIATIKFYKAGYFSWDILWPFALGSIPLSFVGGAITLPGHVYKPIVGVVLLFAAARLAWETKKKQEMASHRPPLAGAVACGASIGLLSGLTGTGGGIFLTPLLLFMRWAETRKSAGISAAFILVNSIAGLAGNVSSVKHLPPLMPYLVVAAIAGGFLGSELGSRRLPPLGLRYLLAVVLVVAGFKLILV